jgi:hypothetical protein
MKFPFSLKVNKESTEMEITEIILAKVSRLCQLPWVSFQAIDFLINRA